MLTLNKVIGMGKNRNRYIILLTLLILGLLISPNTALILISVYLIYLYTSNLDVITSKLLNIVLSFTTYALFLGCVILASWLLSHEFPLTLTPLLGLIILSITGILYMYSKPVRFRAEANKDLALLHADDVWSLLVSIFITLIIIMSSIASTAGSKVSPFYGLVSGNVDDAPHIGMINDRIQFNRGVLLHTDIQNKSRFSDASIAYPASWHASNAVLIKSINPLVATGEQTLFYFGLIKTFWFFILVFLITRVSFMLIPAQRYSKNNTFLRVFWLILSSSLLSILFLVDIFREGFFSFIPQLISILILCIYLAAHITKKDIKDKLSIVPIVGVVGIGGTLSWVLILPALFILIVGVFAYSMKQRKALPTFKYVVQNLSKELVSNPLVYTTLLCALFVQLYIMRFSPSPLSFKESILLPGGVAVYNDMFYIFLYTGALAAFIIPKKIKSLSVTLIYSAACILMFAAVIFLIQLILAGRTEYYYYKTLHVATVTIIPLSIFGYYLVLKMVSEKSKFAALGIAVFLIMILVQSAGKANIETFQYLSGQRKINQATLNVVQSLIQKNNSTPYESREVYIFDTPLIDSHEIATMLIKSNSPYSDCFNELTANYRYGGDTKKTMKTIKNSCMLPVTIITTAENAPSLINEAAAESVKDKKLEIVILEDIK